MPINQSTLYRLQPRVHGLGFHCEHGEYAFVHPPQRLACRGTVQRPDAERVLARGQRAFAAETALVQPLEVPAAAFDALYYVAAARLEAGRITVIDATNTQREPRKAIVELARKHHVLPVAIVLDMSETLCTARNGARADRDFGAHVNLPRGFDIPIESISSIPVTVKVNFPSLFGSLIEAERSRMSMPPPSLRPDSTATPTNSTATTPRIPNTIASGGPLPVGLIGAGRAAVGAQFSVQFVPSKYR
jgi:hypothetical protein